jgi:hypothetical protein
MWERSVPDSRQVGGAAVEALVADQPGRGEVWGALSDDDREIMAVWLGMSRSPLTRRDRRRRAGDAFDLGPESVRRLLHQRVDITMPVDMSSFPPW